MSVADIMRAENSMPFTSDTKTTYEEIYNMLSSFEEGLTSHELKLLLGADKIYGNPSAYLSHMVKEGLAYKKGYRPNPDTNMKMTVYFTNGKPFSERKSMVKKSKRLDQELIDLRTWKKNAIARFPELAIDPIVAKAREQVAKIYRDDGNDQKAQMVESGEMDEGDAMKVAISMLRNRYSGYVE